MGAPSRKPDIDIFRKIANACGGVLSDIAAHIGVDRVTVYAWCNDDPEFKQALEDSRERFLDLAESNLRKLVAGVPAIEKDENGEKRFAGWIERPSETAIIFTLKTRGKNGDKSDNRRDNLVCFPKAEHTRRHQIERKK